MPSTQTGTRSAAARVVTARTIAELSRLASMLVTKLRSILMMSNGSDLRCASDEKPVPKSSSASRMPWFFRLVTMLRARSMSANSELSVISMTRRSAGKPLKTDNLAGAEVDLRLEIGNELAVLEPKPNALLDLAMGNERAFHAGIEPDRAGHTASASMVHGNVGASKYVRNASVGRAC